MKNKLSKLLATFMLLIAITAIIPCIAYAKPSFELIESENGNTIVIHNETPGELYDLLVASSKCQYKYIRVIGNMNDSDFGCLSLMSSNCKSIDLHEVKADRIPSYEFCCKYNLEEFICPPGIKTIERNCFVQCENLQKFDLPKGLESIGNYDFYLCRRLLLNVPKTVKVGENALLHCGDLLSIEYNSDDFMEEPESSNSEQIESNKKSWIFYIVSLFKRFKIINHT